MPSRSTEARTRTPDYSVDAVLVPDRRYGQGGHHFSNGPTWIEQFAASVGLAASVQPAFLGQNPVAANYAVGGARAYEGGRYMNLPTQVGTFLQQVGGVAPADDLYVIEIGGNDIRDALAAFAARGNPAVVIQEALASIAGRSAFSTRRVREGFSSGMLSTLR